MTKKKDSITPKQKKKFVIEDESTIENQTCVFIEAIGTVDIASPLSRLLYQHFNDEMRKAVNEGCVCTNERMAILYPIFREINVEQDEIQAELENDMRITKMREAKKLAKRNGGKNEKF